MVLNTRCANDPDEENFQGWLCFQVTMREMNDYYVLGFMKFLDKDMSEGLCLGLSYKEDR